MKLVRSTKYLPKIWNKSSKSCCKFLNSPKICTYLVYPSPDLQKICMESAVCKTVCKTQVHLLNLPLPKPLTFQAQHKRYIYSTSPMGRLLKIWHLGVKFQQKWLHCINYKYCTQAKVQSRTFLKVYISPRRERQMYLYLKRKTVNQEKAEWCGIL